VVLLQVLLVRRAGLFVAVFFGRGLGFVCLYISAGGVECEVHGSSDSLEPSNPLKATNTTTSCFPQPTINRTRSASPIPLSPFPPFHPPYHPRNSQLVVPHHRQPHRRLKRRSHRLQRPAAGEPGQHERGDGGAQCDADADADDAR